MKASARESCFWRTVFDNVQKKERILDIETEVSKPEFWDNQKRALKLSQELSALKEEKELFGKIFSEWQDLSELAKIGIGVSDTPMHRVSDTPWNFLS